MDLAKRLVKIMQNQRGILVFAKTPEPSSGFATVTKVEAYNLSATTADELITAVRGFLMSHLFIEDGITVYRRGGYMTVGRVSVFATQTEAETAARVANISHIVNLTDKSNIQVGDFAPDVPGDGDV